MDALSGVGILPDEHGAGQQNLPLFKKNLERPIRQFI
jgi:hypothetical protein